MGESCTLQRRAESNKVQAFSLGKSRLIVTDGAAAQIGAGGDIEVLGYRGG